jgi:hypothetical protein
VKKSERFLRRLFQAPVKIIKKILPKATLTDFHRWIPPRIVNAVSGCQMLGLLRIEAEDFLAQPGRPAA